MNKKNKNNKSFDEKIGITMRVGVSIAAAIMIFGFILLLINFDENFASFEDVNLENVIFGLFTFNPYSYLFVGVFLLILTPVLRVVTSIILFEKEKDKLYSTITSIVLVILIISFIVGIITR